MHSRHRWRTGRETSARTFPPLLLARPRLSPRLFLLMSGISDVMLRRPVSTRIFAPFGHEAKAGQIVRIPKNVIRDTRPKGQHESQTVNACQTICRFMKS